MKLAENMNLDIILKKNSRIFFLFESFCRLTIFVDLKQLQKLKIKITNTISNY